jgi:hypothetical protein
LRIHKKYADQQSPKAPGSGARSGRIHQLIQFDVTSIGFNRDDRVTQ